MKNFKFLICFVGVTFCSVAMAEELKFKFAPGDRYFLVSVTEQKRSRVIDGNEQTFEQTTQLECDFDVEEIDEAGIAWVKYVYKRVVMKARSAELNFVFDSDANQLKTPPQAMPLRLAVGEGLYLRITPQGRLEKINGLQALITSAKAKIGNFAGAGTVSQAITQRFAEPTVRRELEDQLRIFPEPNEGGPTCPVRKDGNTELSNKSQISNGTWVRTNVLSSAEAGNTKVGQIEEANIIFERTFRLNPDKSGQGGIAVVDVNLVIRPVSAPVLSTPPERDDQAQASESAVKANREILGEGAGRIEIEKATGRIISSKMTQDTTERVKYITQGPMLRPPPAPEPITTHTVTTFQMTKIEGAKLALPADANEKGA